MSLTQEEILKCVPCGDSEGMKERLGGEGVTEEVLGLKDEAGRNVLLTACMLGRSSIVRELLRNGADVNERTVRGYSSLHLAACWGHLDTVRTLIDLGADTQTETFSGERPVDLARKYSKTDCVDCLILAEAKQDLVSYVDFIKDLMSDPERKLTKGEKNICARVCSEKADWIDGVQQPTVSDFILQRKDMEESLQSVLSNLLSNPVDVSVQSEGED